MGKQKRHNKRIDKIRDATNPVGIPSVAETISRQQDEESGPSLVVPPVVKDLDSLKPSDREQACLSLANIVLEQRGRHLELLVRVGAVKKLVQSLCDPHQPVRTAAAGTLRNITIVGGETICEDLVSDDIMTPLLAAIRQSLEQILQYKEETADVNAELDSNAVDSEDEDVVVGDASNRDRAAVGHIKYDEKKEELTTLSEALHLLSFLCENSDRATRTVTRFGESSLLPSDQSIVAQCFLTILTNPITRSHKRLQMNAVQCLNVISDDNEALQRQLLSIQGGREALLSLLSDSQNSSLLYRTCICAILFNLHSNLRLISLNDMMRVIETILPTLSHAMRYDCVRTFVDNLMTYRVAHRQKRLEDIQEAKMNLLGASGMDDDEHVRQYVDEEDYDEDDYDRLDDDDEQYNDDNARRYDEWLDRINSQKMSLEIITNIVSTLILLNDDDAVEEYDDDDDDEQYEDQIVDEQEDETIDDQSAAIQFIEQHHLFETVFEQCRTLAEALRPSTNNPLYNVSDLIARDIASMRQVQLRSLSCLSNVIAALDLSLLIKHVGNIQHLWNFLFELCVQQYDRIVSNDDHMTMDAIESLTQIMWTLSRKTNDNIDMMTSSVGDLFAKLSCDDNRCNEQIRTNCIGILGELGKRPHDIRHNTALARLLSNRLLHDPSLAVKSECLNAIFDVYADERFNGVLVETQLLQVLNSLVLNDSRKLSKELRGRVNEAKLNLKRFIKYKRQEMAK